MIYGCTGRLPPVTDAQKRSFGRVLYELRLNTEFSSRQEFADACDLALDTVLKLESGDMEPCYNTISKLCRGLEIVPETLMKTVRLRMEGEKIVEPFIEKKSRE
jgi:transcriptional regulator with XRE-family HTH domain